MQKRVQGNSELKALAGANVPCSLINRASMGSGDKTEEDMLKRIMRFSEKRKEEKTRTEIHFWNGIGTFSAVTGGRRRLRLLRRTIGADVGMAAGSPGRVGQCDIAIRLMRAGRHRQPVVRMAIKRGRAVHGVPHVDVHPKNVSASDRETLPLHHDCSRTRDYFPLEKDRAELDPRIQILGPFFPPRI